MQILRYAYQARTCGFRFRPIRRPRFALAPLAGTSMTSEVTVSISSPIELASGPVTRADRLAVLLIKPTGRPTMILIKWPPKPTVVEPVKLQTTVAAIVKVLAAAQIEYAARRAAGL